MSVVRNLPLTLFDRERYLLKNLGIVNRAGTVYRVRTPEY